MRPTGGDSHPTPAHFVEITILSAQDLFQAAKSSMRTYVVVWSDPTHKLRTSVDVDNHANPAWNDKLGFRLGSETLRSDTSSINFDIYAARSRRLLPGSDTLLGSARAMISTLHLSTDVKFVALQVRRPSSLRPQGILNVGIALVDAGGGGKGSAATAAAGGGGGGGGGGGVEKKLVKSRSVREMERKLERWKVEFENERKGMGRSRRTNAGVIPWKGRGGEGLDRS